MQQPNPWRRPPVLIGSISANVYFPAGGAWRLLSTERNQVSVRLYGIDPTDQKLLVSHITMKFPDLWQARAWVKDKLVSNTHAEASIQMEFEAGETLISAIDVAKRQRNGKIHFRGFHAISSQGFC